MTWKLLWLLPLLVLSSACLGRLQYDPAVERMTLAPAGVIGLRERENRTYWLLRGAPGWKSAHEVRFGGEPKDDGVATIRAVRFESDVAAQQGFEKLTAAYLYAAFRDRITGEPEPFDYPEPLDGDDVGTWLYLVKLPPDTPPEVVIRGQYTTVRAGTVVYLIESIGVHERSFVPAVRELVRAAHATESLPRPSRTPLGGRGTAQPGR